MAASPAEPPSRGFQKPPNIRALLKAYQITPNRRLGQNFLVDQAALRKVVQAAGLTGEEWVLEVGAGLGSLTYYLSERAQNVIAVEYDQRLIPALEAVLVPMENVRLVVKDILQLDLEEWIGGRKYYVVANIPYNITSALIRRFLEAPHSPERIVLTLQKEVAERIIAPPGKLSLLALSVRMYGNPDLMGSIPAKAFYPQPKVESSIIRINTHPLPLVERELVPVVFQLARAGFHQKRKQLRNSLAAGLGLKVDCVLRLLESCGVEPSQRAQELTLENWIGLARELHAIL